ncbi:MAG: hypothetical protein ACFBSC_02165 [Microcoleaceae cyanobacterium]
MNITSKTQAKPGYWLAIILGIFAFWMGGSLVLDMVVMPSMYMTGMMEQPDFVLAGSFMFSVFNHVEILCAATGLTGILILGATLPEGFSNRIRTMMILSLFLVGVSLVYTYGLTPEMSSLGISLDLFNETAVFPKEMIQLQLEYWGLEVLKLATAGLVAGWCLRNFRLAEEY